MKFSNSIAISTGLHVLFILLMPGFRFAQIKTDWIEVAVVSLPNISESRPSFMAGKRLKQTPAPATDEMEKKYPDLLADKNAMGIPVSAETEAMPEFIEERDYEFSIDAPEKIIPGRNEKSGIFEDEGENEIFVISGPITKRKLLRRVYPKYPEWAEERGVEGEVKLKFWVSPEGMVSSVELEKTSGYPELDSRAMEALKKYLFSPLGKNDDQKEQWGTITIKYTLK